MAYTKKTTAKIEEPKSVEEPVMEKPIAKPKKEYKGDDLIPCRSVVQGELIYVSKKSDNRYIWSNYGDIKEVEYQDLTALRAKRSRFVFGPLFIIEDEELLEDSRWQPVKELYDNLYSVSDIYEVLELPNDQFRKALEKMSKSFRKAVCSEVNRRLEEGLFDSIQKVKIIDEICGTDLKVLL